jgi:hypothetical protein
MEDQLALFIRWRIFFSSVLGVVAHAMNNSSENPCQRMKGSNGWKISWHFLSVGEFHFHRFWASHLRHEQLLRKSLPTDERFQRMEDQLALFIRWRIFFSSVLGVVLDAMNNSSENSWVRTLPACFRPGAEAR